MIDKLERFKFWCQKVLPLVYDDSLSYYEVLCKVVDYINDLIKNNNEIADILEIYDGDIRLLKKDVKELQIELNKISNGEYMSIYIDALAKWIDNNLQELVGRIVKFVAFELDDSGYFIAYIPETWKFLKFDTIVDTENKNYGCLTIQW